MLHLQLANMPIIQLPDPNKPYLLFMDESKHCYSGILTQASTDESNAVLIQLPIDNDPLTSVESQTQDLRLNSNLVHPVAYISGSFTESQCRWPTITKECFGIFMSIKKCSFYLCNSDLLVQSDHEPLLKIFTGNTDNEKCNTWGLEAATIPQCIKVQHIKGIANILADSVSRLEAVGLYHILDFQNSQPELGTPYEPLPPMEQATHTPITVQEIFIKTNEESLAKQFTISQIENPDISLEDVSPKDAPHFEKKLMSIPKLTPDKIISNFKK